MLTGDTSGSGLPSHIESNIQKSILISLIINHDASSQNIFIALTLVQYPLYGAIIGNSISKLQLRKTVIILLSIHIIAIIAAFYS